MRCLYCGKELALLKRLTGGGEFCSEAHKQSYQEEYNRLALSRLMQARTQKAETKPAPPPPAQPAAPIAVAELAVEGAVREKPVAPREVAALAPPPEPPRPEPPSPPSAGFSVALPSLAPPKEASLYAEPWRLDDPTIPPPPAWKLESPSAKRLLFTLPLGDLLPLAVQAGMQNHRLPVAQTKVSPKEFGQPKINLSARLSVTRPHEFQPFGSIAVEIAPRPAESSNYASLHAAVDFASPAFVQGFELLAPVPAGIAFPEEDCDVTIAESWTNGIVSEAPMDLAVPPVPDREEVPEMPAETAASGTIEASPRVALQALSRLHQDMRERQEAAAPPPAPEAEAAKPAAQPAPREASELLPIAVKSFPPHKPGTVVNATALVAEGNPLIPRLKGLPLRPKVAPAPANFDPQPKAAAAHPVAEAKTKPASATQAVPAKVQPAQPVDAPQPAPSAPASKAALPGPEAKAEKPAVTARTKPPAPAQPPVQTKPAAADKPAAAAPPAPQPPKPVDPGKGQKTAETGQPAAAPKPNPPQPAKVEKPRAPAAAPAPAGAAQNPAQAEATVPNFGAVVNTSMFGSLKVKIGIAAIVAGLSVGGYFLFVGKSVKPPAPARTLADGLGPNIMLAQGGWVEGWAGDPAGLRAERQITIYRPSLKLTDYRFEFEGQIETKSIGWVIRAADPQNYYAMKLVLVSPELPLQVELYKYLVLKGRQVQVGRVPIDVPVKNDTVFKIRVDVRGPKFSAFVQGQPVDVWTDDQLKSGGVGFLNERNERGKIKSVALFYLTGPTK